MIQRCLVSIAIGIYAYIHHTLTERFTILGEARVLFVCNHVYIYPAGECTSNNLLPCERLHSTVVSILDRFDNATHEHVRNNGVSTSRLVLTWPVSVVYGASFVRKISACLKGGIIFVHGSDQLHTSIDKEGTGPFHVSVLHDKAKQVSGCKNTLINFPVSLYR